MVTAIIAILASMLLPALGKAREAAKKTKCISNEKQIGQAFAFYANDNKDYYFTPNINWDWLAYYNLGKYLNIQKQPPGWDFMKQPVTVCPALKSTAVCRAGYQPNIELISGANHTPAVPQLTTKIKNASQVFLTVCGDGINQGTDRYFFRTGLFGWNNHLQYTTNFLYADFHAANFKFIPADVLGNGQFLRIYAYSPLVQTYAP